MNKSQIRTIIERAGQSWVEGDGSAFSQLFTTNGEFIVPGKRWQGRSAICDALASFAARHSAVRVEIKRIIVDGNQAVVEWLWEDTEDETGIRHRAEDAIVVDFVDGRISRWREYIDAQSPAVDA